MLPDARVYASMYVGVCVGHTEAEPVPSTVAKCRSHVDGMANKVGSSEHETLNPTCVVLDSWVLAVLPAGGVTQRRSSHCLPHELH